MSDEDQTPWLTGLPEEPEQPEPTELTPVPPQIAKLLTEAATPKTKYEPFRWS